MDRFQHNHFERLLNSHEFQRNFKPIKNFNIAYRTSYNTKRVAHDEVQWIDRWSAPENDMDLVRADTGANWLETNYNTCGQGVRGEVMDGGFEVTHMDFDGLLLHGSNSSSSHGTSTYGIVFGNGNRDGDGNAQGTGQLVCSGVQGIAAGDDSQDLGQS